MINETNRSPLYIINKDEAVLHISKGNSKIGKGIYSFSTLPGNKDNLLMLANNALLTNIHGTCSKYCERCFNGGCYAVNSAKRHHNVVIRAWADNTILLRKGKVFDEIDTYITKKNSKFYASGNENDHKVKIFRINVSGEIESAKEFENWNRLAIKHPEVIFSVYTKNFDALDEFIKAGNKDASNFVINISQWHHVADAILAKYPGKFNVFEYDDSNVKNNTLSDEDKLRLSHTRHCPAVSSKGKHVKKADGTPVTCDTCLHCYKKSGLITAVYAH